MAGYEQLTAVGNVGRDVEVRQTQNGGTVANWSLAVTTRWTDRTTNEKRERTTWYSCSAWGKLAEVAERYIHKGTQMLVVGTPSARAWLNKDGEAMASLDLRVDSFELMGGRDSGSSYEADEQEVPSNNGSGGGSLEDIPFGPDAD